LVRVIPNSAEQTVSIWATSFILFLQLSFGWRWLLELWKCWV